VRPETIEAWLASRLPARPAALAAQMTRSVAACPRGALEAATTMADALGVLGAATLRAVASQERASAELALELLAADGFVTYAFEAAAEEGVDVGPLAARLLGEAA
jgi:hypothetical protein